MEACIDILASYASAAPDALRLQVDSPAVPQAEETARALAEDGTVGEDCGVDGAVYDAADMSAHDIDDEDLEDVSAQDTDEEEEPYQQVLEEELPFPASPGPLQDFTPTWTTRIYILVAFFATFYGIPVRAVSLLLSFARQMSKHRSRKKPRIQP
jgi:hypothetical protein